MTRALPFFGAFLARGVVHLVEPPVALVREVALIVQPKHALVVTGAIHAGAQFRATSDRKHLLAHQS